MPARDEEFNDLDNIKRRVVESESIATTDNYASVSFPLRTGASPVVSSTYLDRYPKRAVAVKNTGVNDILFQVEGSMEQNPNNGTESHWSVLDDRTDYVILPGTLRFESSLDVPYEAIRVRIKSRTPGLPSTVVVFIGLGKW